MNHVVEFFMNKGYLISPEIIDELNEDNKKEVLEYLSDLKEKPLVIDKVFLKMLKQNKPLIQINWSEFDKSKVLFEKDKDKSLYNSFLTVLDQKPGNIFTEQAHEPEIEVTENNESNVVILKNYLDEEKKYTVQDFVTHFRLRYEKIKNLLMTRKEMQNATSIHRILGKFERNDAAIIGMVSDKNITKNGNVLLKLEDPTGIINVVVSKNKHELFEVANDTLLDEVIGVTGKSGDKIIFANDLFYPDIPVSNELRKAEKEEYAVFTSDMQVGSKVFFEKNFLKFIDWLNGDYGGEEQREIAKKVKYLFIPGDLVEGVGVYPGQEEDLEISDIYKQYDKFCEYISKVRKDIKIIVSPGNHDAMRIAEPQPVFDKKTAKLLYEMENVFLTTNPAIVNIASTESFLGFNVLIYHGFSFPYVAENVESIRKAGRLDNPELIMKYLLQRRHLAPSHASTQYLPHSKEDCLMIEKIPDFLISGHIHKTKVANYRNITMMNCSCWIAQTEDQERRGIKPDPCKAILVNLKTRDIKILNFNEKDGSK